VSAPVVVGVDEPGNHPAGLVHGLEVDPRSNSCPRVELKLSAAALSNAYPANQAAG